VVVAVLAAFTVAVFSGCFFTAIVEAIFSTTAGSNPITVSVFAVVAMKIHVLVRRRANDVTVLGALGS
jgi:hypothetical protein